MTPAQFSEYCKLSPEEFKVLLEILNDPELVEWAHLIADQCFIPETAGSAPELPEGERLAKAWFAAAFFGAEAAKEHYRKKGLPVEVLYETMTDITAWLRNSKRNHGVIGLSYARLWEVMLWHGEVTRHGRLECNTESFYDGPELTDESGSALVKKDDPVIQLHIPEDGPMDLDSCGRSMKRMSEFFAQYRPDYHWAGFSCVSWLFDPQLLPMFPNHSNVLKFHALGCSYPVDIKSDTKFRVFGSFDPDTIKNPTTLQRNAAVFLRSGGVFKEGGLFIPRKAVEAVNYDLEKLFIRNSAED